ncbi:MAG: hypothetical protein IJ853_02135 [Rickettsiales bacterium]|nr:hypothetical protein [Rickettsiales bacterium]
MSLILLPYFVNAQENQNCELVINGKCTDCNDTNSFEINTGETCKALCPNRKVFYPRGQIYCGLKNCPQEYPIRDEKYGHCLAEKIENNRVYDGEFKEIHNAIQQYGMQADDGKCPPNKPLLSVSGSKKWCFPCDYPFEIDLSVEYAKICPNRVSISYPWNNDKDYTASYLSCPEDKPLRSWSGKCFSCDYPEVVRVITQCLEDDTVCDVCPNRIILPQMGGNRPSVLRCPSYKPLMDVAGICFDCDIDIPVEIAKEADCEKYCSPKRKTFGVMCIKSNS